MMARVPLALGALMLSLGMFGWDAAEAQGLDGRVPRREVTRVTRVESRTFPILVSGPDTVQNRRLLELAEKVSRSVAVVLLPLDDPQTGFVLQWVQTPPGTRLPEAEFPQRLRLDGPRKEFVIEFWGELPRMERPLVRSLVTSMVQAVAWQGVQPRLGQDIPRPPFWLTEGIGQRILDQRKEDWAEVVARLHRTNKLPTLQEIQDWEELSDWRQDAYVQQAVSYWLARQVARTPVESKTLRLWLQSTRADSRARYWDPPSGQEAWWRRAALEKLPTEIPIFTWEQTAGRLRDALHFSAKLKGESETRILSIMDLPESPDQLEGERPWSEVSAKLIQMRAQSHWLWIYVIEKYDSALGAWVQGKPTEYRRYLAEALILQERMNDLMVGSGDLLDWVTVNYPARVEDQEWLDFRALVQDVENRSRSKP